MISSIFDSWEIYQKKTYPETIKNLIEAFIYLPYPEIQEPLLFAYSLLPTSLCHQIPYLLLYGQSGSGKSTAGNLIAKIRGTELFTSADTFSAIRNNLNLLHAKTRNPILVWDDLDPKLFDQKPDIYRLLKCGYNRDTSKIYIAGNAGSVVGFDTFCPKVMSSIHPLFDKELFPELSRRLAVISFKKPPKAKRNIPQIGFTNWEGLPEKFNDFWSDEKCEYYLKLKKDLAFIAIKENRVDWLPYCDIMACQICTGYFKKHADSFAWLIEYLRYLERLQDTKGLGIIAAIKEYVHQEQEKSDQLSARLGKPIEAVISPKRIKDHLDLLYENGELATRPNNGLIFNAMTQLGYELFDKEWRQKL